MPNWCDNTLTVHGDRNVTEFFIKFLRGKHETISLNKMAPHTDGWAELADGVAEDNPHACAWYEWNLTNWGTKWNATGAEEWKVEDDKASVRFLTAWSPPIEAVTSLSKRFSDILFTLAYGEDGMQFYGESEFQNGQEARTKYLDDGCGFGWDLEKDRWVVQSWINEDTGLSYRAESILDDEELELSAIQPEAEEFLSQQV